MLACPTRASNARPRCSRPAPTITFSSPWSPAGWPRESRRSWRGRVSEPHRGILTDEKPDDTPTHYRQFRGGQLAAGMADWLSQQPALPVMVAREGERPAAGRGLLAGTSDHL